MLLRRRLQVVDLTQFCPDILVSLLPAQLVLVVVTRVTLLAAFSLDFEHAGDIHWMRLEALDLVLAHLFHWLVRRVFEDDAVQLGQIDVFAVWVSGKRGWHFVLGALAQLWHFLVLMAVVVVRLGKAVCEIVQVLMCTDGLEQLLIWRGFVVEVDTQFLCLWSDAGKQLCCIWSIGRIDLQHALNGSSQLFGIIISDLGVYSLNDFLVKPIHVLSSEGRLECGHLIDHASKTPDIRLVIIRLVFPNLRTSIVRSSSLSIEESILGDLRNIHVSQLGSSSLV